MPRRRDRDPSVAVSPLSMQRMITFSDAVFAIAATLLVIDLRPPQTGSGTYEAALSRTCPSLGRSSQPRSGSS